jgi:hypothetical protein
MIEFLKLLLHHFRQDTKKPWAWVPLLVSGLVVIVEGSLEHRFYVAFNDWQDIYLRSIHVHWLSPIILSPFLLVAVTVCVILIHAAIASRQEIKGREHTEEALPGGIAGQYPRLAIDVELLQSQGMSPTSGVILTNVGDSEAHRLHINDMLVSGRKVTFPANTSVLIATGKTHPIVPTIHGVAPIGPIGMHDFVGLMADDWDTQARVTGVPMPEVLTFPASATYEDHRGRKFLASWQFEFHIFKYRNWKQRQKKGTDKWLPDNIGPFVTVPKVETKLLD